MTRTRQDNKGEGTQLVSDMLHKTYALKETLLSSRTRTVCRISRESQLRTDLRKQRAPLAKASSADGICNREASNVLDSPNLNPKQLAGQPERSGTTPLLPITEGCTR